MNMDDKIKQTVEEKALEIPISKMREISDNLTKRYKESEKTGKSLVTTAEEALTYAVVRMPATYGAVSSALFYTLETLKIKPETIIDVGAGTGSGTLAAYELLPTLKSAVCVERDDVMRDLGMRIFDDCKIKAEWIKGDFKQFNLPKSDLAIASYTLNELKKDDIPTILKRLMASCDTLLIVEPGTPSGFEIISAARSYAILNNLKIAAPCPEISALNPCPLSENDWCAFSQRIARSKLHKLIKEADTPYEDEKYSFIALTHGDIVCIKNRILRHPVIKKGYVTLKLCQNGEVCDITLCKSDGERYKAAKKRKQGDSL